MYINTGGHKSIRIVTLAIFVSMITFPAQALAFVNTVEFSHPTLKFNLDPSLEDAAIVGIEAFPPTKTVANLLQSDSFQVRSSLAPGSTIRVLSTAYSSMINQTDASPSITASGITTHFGTMAANFLPFGTKVRVGHNMYTITDRMNSRYNDKYIVDIWLPNRLQAISYGIKIVELEVISIP